jgi:hypothetical protein
MSEIIQNYPTNDSMAIIGGQSLVAAYTGVTAGNVIFMCAYDNNGIGLTVSDDDSNTWYVDYNSNNLFIAHCYAAYSGDLNVTLARSGGGYFEAVASSFEVSGLASGQTAAVDTSYASSFGTNVNSGSVEPTGDHFYLAANMVWGGSNASNTLTGSWQRISYTASAGDVDYLDASGTQSYTSTLSTDRTWRVVLLAYSVAAASSGSSVPIIIQALGLFSGRM